MSNSNKAGHWRSLAAQIGAIPPSEVENQEKSQGQPETPEKSQDADAPSASSPKEPTADDDKIVADAKDAEVASDVFAAARAVEDAVEVEDELTQVSDGPPSNEEIVEPAETLPEPIQEVPPAEPPKPRRKRKNKKKSHWDSLRSVLGLSSAEAEEEEYEEDDEEEDDGALEGAAPVAEPEEPEKVSPHLEALREPVQPSPEEQRASELIGRSGKSIPTSDDDFEGIDGIFLDEVASEAEILETGDDEDEEDTVESRPARREAGGRGRSRGRRRGRRSEKSAELKSTPEEGLEDETQQVAPEADTLGESRPGQDEREDEEETNGPTRRRRRRRRSRKASDVESTAPDLEDDQPHDAFDDDDDDDEDFRGRSKTDDRSDRDSDRRRDKHKKIPSWTDAVLAMVDANIQRHESAPASRSYDRGGRGGRRRRGGSGRDGGRDRR